MTEAPRAWQARTRRADAAGDGALSPSNVTTSRPLGQAPVDLALHDQWIDDGPTIVHVEVFRELHRAGVRIELDDGHAGTTGEGVGQGLPVRGRFQTPLQVAGQLARVIGLTAHLGPGDVAVGAVLDEELPLPQGYGLRVTVEGRARDLHGLGWDALGG